MAGGIDQPMANAVLTALNGGTPLSITGPIKLRLMTANGSDTAPGTELATSGGYTAGGQAIASWATAAAGTQANSSAVSWTNMPATTLAGLEQWESSATPRRTIWGPWQGGNIPVATGNTLTVASGALVDALA